MSNSSLFIYPGLLFIYHGFSNRDIRNPSGWKTGKLTQGIVKDILTKSGTHPHGIKVRLENGLVGRVKAVRG